MCIRDSPRYRKLVSFLPKTVFDDFPPLQKKILSLDEVSKRYFLRTLVTYEMNIDKTAIALKISRRWCRDTLREILFTRYGIKVDELRKKELNAL